MRETEFEPPQPNDGVGTIEKNLQQILQHKKLTDNKFVDGVRSFDADVDDHRMLHVDFGSEGKALYENGRPYMLSVFEYSVPLAELQARGGGIAFDDKETIRFYKVQQDGTVIVTVKDRAGDAGSLRVVSEGAATEQDVKQLSDWVTIAAKPE